MTTVNIKVLQIQDKIRVDYIDAYIYKAAYIEADFETKESS